MSEGYRVYSNGGSGPVDYSTPVATLSGFGTGTQTWTSGPLAVGSTTSFAVRAFSDAGGEESNIDARVSIALDAAGADITNVPLAPAGLRAFATAGGGVRVEWGCGRTVGAKAPAAFAVYAGTGGTPDYSAPVATVAAAAGIAGSYVANLTGLTPGSVYSVGVRARNGSGEESNTASVFVTPKSTGPLAVTNLVASTTY